MDQDKEDEEKKFIRDTTMVCYKPPWGATFGSPLGGSGGIQTHASKETPLRVAPLAGSFVSGKVAMY